MTTVALGSAAVMTPWARDRGTALAAGPELPSGITVLVPEQASTVAEAIGDAVVGNVTIIDVKSGVSVPTTTVGKAGIVLKARSVGGSTVTGKITLNGANCYVHGFRFAPAASVEINGDDCQVSRNSWASVRTGRAVNVKNGNRARVYHNTFESCEGDAVGISPTLAGKGVQAKVWYNDIFRGLEDRIVGIRVGTSCNQSSRDFNADVRFNRVEGWLNDNSIEIKGQRVTIQQNHVIGDTKPGVIRVRHGAFNKIIANHVEAGAIFIAGDANEAIGNLLERSTVGTVRGKGLVVASGELTLAAFRRCNAGEDGNPSVNGTNTLLARNRADLTYIGGDQLLSTAQPLPQPARDTRIEAHPGYPGNTEIDDDRSTGTTYSSSTSVQTPPPAPTLSRSQVGAGAPWLGGA